MQEVKMRLSHMNLTISSHLRTIASLSALGALLLAMTACGSDDSGDGASGDGDGDSSGDGDGSGSGDGDGDGDGDGGVTEFPDDVLPADEVRDETGLSILDPEHPFHANLAPVATTEPNTDEEGGINENGTFRIKCDWSHGSYDDPIVFPGIEGAAHMHMFLGNHEANADSTTESLLASGMSTCQGSELNRSAYWVPWVLHPLWEGDAAVTDGEGERAYGAVLPIDGIDADNNGPDIYYKRQTAGDIRPMPEGLRMIAGGADSDDEQTWEKLRYACEEAHHTGAGEFYKHIPVCEVGDKVLMDIWFPPCWDGENLDSPDHKSHMAYPAPEFEGAEEFVCPDTHPISLPQVSYHFKYPVTEENGGPTGSSRGWKLSSDMYNVPDDGEVGGYSLHADWFMAWHPEASALFTQHCINERRKCANGDLGNGFRLERMDRGPQNVPDVVNRGLGDGHPH